MKIFAFLTCCTVALASDITWTNSPVVITNNGQYQGSIITAPSSKQIYAYTGIPYATLKSGAYKFQAASPITPHEGIFDATKQAPAPPMPYLHGESISDDKLYANIYTTAAPSARQKRGVSHGGLPVIVFFHSYEYNQTFGSIAGIGPHYTFAQDAVLVTINYRGGPLGFMATGDSYAPGNAGLKDQQLGLKFVNQIISAFGGNPSSVTLVGSGNVGAGSALFHLLAPGSASLFSAVVMIAPSPVFSYNLPYDNKVLASKFFEYAGCPTDFSAGAYECLGGKSAQEYTAAYSKLAAQYGEYALFAPVVESAQASEYFFNVQPKETFASGNFNKKPIMIGAAKSGDSKFISELIIAEEQAQSGNTALYEKYYSDWAGLVSQHFVYPYYYSNAGKISEDLKSYYFGDKHFAAGSYSSLANFNADVTSFYPIHEFVDAASKYTSVYEYLYDYSSSKPFKTFSNGTTAGVYNNDLFTLLFHTAEYSEHSAVDEEKSNYIWGCIFNLSSGSPTPSGQWVASTPTARKYFEYSGDAATLKSGVYHQESMQKLEELFASSSNQV